MSTTNDTRKAADEIGRQVFESMHAEETPDKPYLDFLEYREYLKSARNTSPSVEEIIGACSIDFGASIGSVALK